jgi:hypothetical protein
MSGRSLLAVILFIALGAAVIIAGNLSGEDTDRTLVNQYRLENFGGDSGENDRITLHYQDYEKDREGPVSFSHKRHALEYEVNCWECHHAYEDGEENTWTPWEGPDECIECHDPVEKIAGVTKLETAFHQNCIVCHQKRDIYAGEPGAYRDCGKCHLRKIRIENTNYEKDRMGPVLFDHRMHEAKYLDVNDRRISCAECHHEYEDGENVWTEEDNVKNCAAAGCHDPFKTKDDRQYKLRIAYHKNCKECHRALRKAGKSKDAPYIKCYSCHRR